MNDSFRNPFTIKMGHLFMQNKILQKQRTTWAGAQGVFVINNVRDTLLRLLIFFRHS